MKDMNNQNLDLYYYSKVSISRTVGKYCGVIILEILAPRGKVHE